MNIAVAAVVVCVAMGFQDFFGVAMVISEARALTFFPGFFDALNDYASRIGAALTAGEYVRHGLLAWQTQLLLALTAVTSFFATNRGTQLASRLLPNDNARTPWALVRSHFHRKDTTP